MIPADDLPESTKPLTAVTAAHAAEHPTMCLLDFRTEGERDLFLLRVRRAIDVEGLAYLEPL